MTNPGTYYADIEDGIWYVFNSETGHAKESYMGEQAAIDAANQLNDTANDAAQESIRAHRVWEGDWEDGYRAGQRFHMDLNYDAKDDRRYQEEDGYAKGFDQAGEDS